MATDQGWLLDELKRRGVSRREFLGFCAKMAAILALPGSAAGAIAKAVESGEKPILVWLEFQDCAGNTESFLRASRPTVADIILDTLSVNYHETLMAAAGHQAEAALAQDRGATPGHYIAVVEGSIPTGANGAYCTIGGRSAIADRARGVRQAPPRRSRWALARRSAAFRRRGRTRLAPSRSATRSRESRT